MHRNASRLADGHQARHDALLTAGIHGDDLAVVIGRDTAHVVVDRRQHRDRLLVDIDASEDLRSLGDARQTLVNDLGAEMLEMQMHVVLILADAAALANLDGHRAADDVARCQILGIRCVALHEALAFGVGQIAALAARAFGDQQPAP